MSDIADVCRSLTKVLRISRQRLVAIILTLLILSSASAQSAIAVADSISPNQSDSSAAPVGTINPKTPPAPSTGLKSDYTAAANAKPNPLSALSKNNGSSSTSFLDSTGKINEPLTKAFPDAKKKIAPHELQSERSADTCEFINADGSITKTHYFSPHFYRDHGSWQSIDNTLVEDDNAADSSNILGQALGKAESIISSPNAYKTKANSWETRFAPSDSSGGMVRIKDKGSQVGFSPVGAKSVDPVVSTDSKGRQTVTYANLWDGVNITYQVQSDKVKESIVLTGKNSASHVQFKMIGAELQAKKDQHGPSEQAPAFSIKGALGGDFSILPANLLLNRVGYVADQASDLTQAYDNSILNVSVSDTYLKNLPSDAFPVVIDPTFGNTGQGSYMSFESNGTSCDPSTCDLYAGGLYDASHNWQDWRGALYVPYTQLQSMTVTNATLHLQSVPGVTTGTYNYQAAAATCTNAYNCMSTPTDNANFTNGTGDINVTDIYQNYVNAGNFSGWVMLDGADGTGNASYADFDPDYSYVNFSFTAYLSPPTFVTPQGGQVYTDPQASFTLNTEANPLDSTPLQYTFQVSSDADGSGFLANSGGSSTTSWTVPDGILVNGSTYYVEAQSYDPYSGAVSPWSAGVPFTVNMREGSTATQTYDTVGPAKIDLATGNLQTGIESHTTSALGGDLGVGLNYSSPIKSSPGLIGSYWNLPNGGSGIPSTTPDLQRADQSINFNWQPNTSPDYAINDDYFAAQWNGYFTVPTTGSYTFGGTNDAWMSITVNGTQVYNNNGCATGPCFGTPISLTAGQVVSFQTSYNHATGSAFASVYVTGAVGQQVLPKAWFQTGVRQLQQHGLTGQFYSYTDTGTPPAIPASGSTSGLFLTQVDPAINYGTQWQGGAPITNGPQQDWLVRWTGYMTVPATGSYTFGASANDGSKITINGTQVYNNWTDYTPGRPVFGTPISLTAGQTVPVEVDYYQHTGSSSMRFLVQPPDSYAVPVPSSWMTPQAPITPNGWNLSFDPGGSVTYTHLSANPSSVILTDQSGDNYNYTWNGSSYWPPANSHGLLTRNADNSWTVQDSDGQTYLFDASGNLASVTAPSDDAKQASFNYTFGNINGNGPNAIQQVTDATNVSRYMKVYYGGASQCGTAPSGFYIAPTNELCAVQTNDGRTTYFYYDQYGNLAEVAKPGNDNSTFEYQAVSNPSGSVIGYEMVGMRNSLANDTIVAGGRSGSDQTTYTSIGYDALGRVSSVANPAATTGGSRVTKTFSYQLAPYSTIEHITGASEPLGYTEKVLYDYQYRTTQLYNNVGRTVTTEWDPLQDLIYSTTNTASLMSTTIYDDEGRPVTEYGPAPSSYFSRWAYTIANGVSKTEGQSIYSEDHRFQLIFQTDGNVVLKGPSGVLWSSGTSGQTATQLTMGADGNLVEYNGTNVVWSTGTSGSGPSTYLIVQNDGNLVLYNGSGPVWSTHTGGVAPAVAPGTYDTPTSTYVSQVPRGDIFYDQGLTGPAVSYSAINESVANRAALTGAPLLHGTNIATNGTVAHDWNTTPPITTSSGNWGMSMTGTMRLTSVGNWNINLAQDGGVRMWIDGQVVIDNWRDNMQANTTKNESYVFNNAVINAAHQIRIDYYHLASTGDANFSMAMTPPGGSQTTAVAQYISPNYGLTTSDKAYDATIGNTTATAGYGTNSALGLDTADTIDATGLNLTASTVYETPGVGYERQTSKTSPGGSTTKYAYYAVTDTATNPCIAGSPAAYQAGLLKTITNPSPDNGTTAGVSTTSIYDDSGNIVATQTGTDGWECKTYDARGRVTQDIVPAYNGQVSRTVSHNYAVSGNPLVSSVTTNDGGVSKTITTTTDILGRTTVYSDSYSNTTSYSYDSLGRISGRNSTKFGNETYTYDSYSRINGQLLNGTIIAKPTYDTSSRLNHVTYPTAGSLALQVGFDALGRESSATYTLGNGTTTLADSDVFTQSGRVATGTQLGVAESYTYDLADRLTAVTIGSNTYSYGYGAQSSTCGTANNENSNSGKDGNRTTQTINGVTQTYCYNYADQLLSGSDPTVGAVSYDTHGNIVSMGNSSTSHATAFTYDSSDRIKKITDTSGSNVYSTDWNLDATDRPIYQNETLNATPVNTYRYGYIDDDSSPSYSTDTGGNVLERYVSLPGGVMLTIRPNNTAPTNQVFSLSNLHGDVMATTDATGAQTGTFAYDPFGNLAAAAPNNTQATTSYGYGGSHQKATLTDFALRPILMGGRVYLPTIGRFTSPDPIPGGTVNPYAYPVDPINSSDFSGNFSISRLVKSVVKAVVKVATAVVRFVAQVISSPPTKTTTTTSKAQAPAHHTVTIKSVAPVAIAAIGPNDDSDVPSAAQDVFRSILDNGYKPLSGYDGGKTFANDGRSGSEILPEGGEYFEHDVYPNAGNGARGLSRIVYDIKSGRGWFSADHYKSFTEIIKGGGEDAEEIIEEVGPLL